jgi:hypothetical protein
MQTINRTSPDATRLIARLRDTADAYTATSEAIPDRSIRLLCDGLASTHRLFASDLQSLLQGAPDQVESHELDMATSEFPVPTIPSETAALHILLDRSCQLEDQFRQTLRMALPNDIDLLIYRLYAKVRRARERLLSLLMAKPYLAGLPPHTDFSLSRCA